MLLLFLVFKRCSRHSIPASLYFLLTLQDDVRLTQGNFNLHLQSLASGCRWMDRCLHACLSGRLCQKQAGCDTDVRGWTRGKDVTELHT